MGWEEEKDEEEEEKSTAGAGKAEGSGSSALPVFLCHCQPHPSARAAICARGGADPGGAGPAPLAQRPRSWTQRSSSARRKASRAAKVFPPQAGPEPAGMVAAFFPWQRFQHPEKALPWSYPSQPGCAGAPMNDLPGFANWDNHEQRAGLEGSQGWKRQRSVLGSHGGTRRKLSPSETRSSRINPVGFGSLGRNEHDSTANIS